MSISLEKLMNYDDKIHQGIKRHYSLIAFERYNYKSFQVKYSYSSKDYSNSLIQLLIDNKNCHLVSVFMDNWIMSYSIEDFLQKLYNIKESQSRLKMFIAHYQFYHSFFCKPTYSEIDLNRMIKSNTNAKAKIYYNEKYQTDKKKLKKKTISLDLIKINAILTTSIKDKIDNYSLTDTIKSNNNEIEEKDFDDFYHGRSSKVDDNIGWDSMTDASIRSMLLKINLNQQSEHKHEYKKKKKNYNSFNKQQCVHQDKNKRKLSLPTNNNDRDRDKEINKNNHNTNANTIILCNGSNSQKNIVLDKQLLIQISLPHTESHRASLPISKLNSNCSSINQYHHLKTISGTINLLLKNKNLLQHQHYKKKNTVSPLSLNRVKSKEKKSHASKSLINTLYTQLKATNIIQQKKQHFNERRKSPLNYYNNHHHTVIKIPPKSLSQPKKNSNCHSINEQSSPTFKHCKRIINPQKERDKRKDSTKFSSQSTSKQSNNSSIKTSQFIEPNVKLVGGLVTKNLINKKKIVNETLSRNKPTTVFYSQTDHHKIINCFMSRNKQQSHLDLKGSNYYQPANIKIVNDFTTDEHTKKKILKENRIKGQYYNDKFYLSPNNSDKKASKSLFPISNCDKCCLDKQ